MTLWCLVKTNIRNATGTVEAIKRELDKFLLELPDQPGSDCYMVF